MADYNLVVLAGRLTCDPELKYTEGEGTPFTKLTLAINRVSTSRDGSYEKTVTHVDVVVWKHQAELAAQYTQKGSRILVSGRIETLRWNTTSGEKRSKLRVRAERLQFLDRRAVSNQEVASDLVEK